MGVLLAKKGQFDKAEQLLKVLFEQASNENEKAIYHNNLGYMKSHRGDHRTAIWFYRKAFETRQKLFLLIIHCSLLPTMISVVSETADFWKCVLPYS